MSRLPLKINELELPVFVRRCHICGDFNEGLEDILKCGACGKSLLPFYYFDKRQVPDASDENGAPPFKDQKSGYGPIRGLTAYW